MVTCEANTFIREVHDRMPVILDERRRKIDKPAGEGPLSMKRLLVPASSDLLLVQPTSPLVNSVKNEGPALREAQRPRLRSEVPTANRHGW